MVRDRDWFGLSRAVWANDPDRKTFQRAALRIGIQVAAVSAVMVAAGAVLFVLYLWWRMVVGSGHEPDENTLIVRLDPVDLAQAGALLGMSAILLAGVAAVWLTRRATAPLAESMRRQRVFVGDASHELRTPLAVMSARAQQLAIMVQDSEELSPVVADLRGDVAVMTEIVNDMLASLSQEASSMPAARFEDVLGDVITDMRVLADQRNVVLAGPTPAGRRHEVALAEVHLRRVLTAVLDNAIGHSPAGGSVEIVVFSRTQFLEIDIVDHGPGITGIEPERVFERFAHGALPEGGATRSSHGIGLALAHDLIASEGGTIEVLRTGPAGSTFRLRVPIAGDVAEGERDGK